MVEVEIPQTVESREALVRGQIKSDTVTLLTRGGVISNTGEVLAYTFNDVDLSLLPENERAKVQNGLDRFGIGSTTLSTTIDVNLRRHKSGRTKIYFVNPEIINLLGYKRKSGKRKADAFYFRHKDTNGNVEDNSIGREYEFSNALINHAKDLLQQENMWHEGFRMTKYFDSILREVADEYGLGDLNNQP